ncbi:MAG TPA: hypothetical protein VK445_05940 [Dissulfurispiraceae bacterium]|nr:hypothetical protein [Dissulfurispiraceae bacterium]
MKLQYLGDSRDSFKWDYHDYLTTKLNYPLFNVALMLTPDDKTNEGATKPHIYKSRPEIIDFCHCLKRSKDIQQIKQLPARTGAAYEISLHKNTTEISNKNRNEYFSGIICENQ